MSFYSFDKNIEMFRHAASVIPGGIPGHKNPAFAIPGSFPYFAERGEGCRYWDVDGNEFIDFLCGYGPIVLGHNHPRVEEAAHEQRVKGTCFNHPTPRTIELAEKFIETVPMADWAVFGRNGSDVTTYAIQVAREHTQKKVILMAEGAYHGSHAWCTPGHGGLIEEDFNNVQLFEWNNADMIHALVKKYEGNVAGVIITPFHHPAFGDCVLPTQEFLNDLQRICKEEGIVLISDDVRAGFRLDMRGSHEYFGFNPDLVTFSKAIANGYSISAAVGTDEMKAAAGKVFFTGSFYTCAVEIAAALATMEILKEENAVETMLARGKVFQEGLKQRADAHGLQVTISGPPSIPFMSFANETNFLRSQKFSSEAAKRGIILHPHHNWFICTAHTDEDIQTALDVADECFDEVKKEFGG